MLSDLPSFPSGIPIPISILVTTWIKSVSPSASCSNHTNTFPVSTTKSWDTSFQLNTVTHAAAESEERHIQAPTHTLTGFGRKAMP
jgi:hypothetical protein